MFDGFDLEFFGIAFAAHGFLLKSFFITQEIYKARGDSVLFVFLLFIAGCAPLFTYEKGKHGPPVNILSAPVDTLREKLKGKTEEEVIALVGEPHQLAVIAEHDAWVYVYDGTSVGRAIVFDSGRVITVKVYD